ncbi:ATP-binding protein [Streptomyces sp. RS10V-4]|uniref:ATP-binding protein n=1 Tax=Streptomyces rhizoryzae TaxID=2932493 RepID=UPI002005DF74|nr:ATP-binding protein [Streptomyces rhizoryzae]MCK7625091.1 ATP-binding protein [Streptomyces rhizoryzae]
MPVIPFPSPSAPSLARPRIPAVPSRWTFPATATSVSRARWAVAGALPADSAPELTEDLVLLTSELVTNAVRHGIAGDEDGDGRLVEVFLWSADGHYWLAVSDPGDGHPVRRAARPGAGCGGRGLVLVDAVSAAWAVVPRHPCGKSVVAGVPLPEG